MCDACGMSDILLQECQRLADELGATMTPPARLKVTLEQLLTQPRKGEKSGVIARVCITSTPAAHQRIVQVDAEGDSETEALVHLKASIALKARFIQNASSGTRGRPSHPGHLLK
jgi:hypothetical protein